MTPIAFDLCSENTAKTLGDTVQWSPMTYAYRCHVCLICEEDGVSAIVLNLPGTGSCGATEEEAIASVKEAVRGVVESYREDGEDIPWCDTKPNDIPKDAKLVWILVNA